MPQINKSSDYFNTKLYTGNGSTQSISGIGFQPDLNWTKDRGATENHSLTDSVRGATKRIFSNTTGAESINVASLTSFDSDGFTVGGAGTHGTNGNNYASWNWKAGGTASSNTDGSITSNVSANTTSGFSIVSYSGTGANATVGHGLNSAPSVVIIKKRSISSTWCFGTSALGFTKFLDLNTTDAVKTNSNRFNDTAPTSSVFSIGTEGDVNTSGTYIAYCFAEKKGFSKFGLYTGNGNTDGTFVYTGFKPAWVMIKNSSSTTSWLMKDNKRTSSGFNPIDKRMFANESSAESTAEDIDFVSNGFKMRTSGANPNVSGGSFIYMAFAENPLVGTNNTPAVAR